MSQNKNNRFMPIWLALCVVAGIVIGSFYTSHFSGNRLNIINSGSSRLSNLLHIIDDQYVDSVNIDDLVEKAIPQILAELDPHSVYISAKDVAKATDDLKGSFSGVGIEFTIRQDTIRVQNIVKNGPAEKAGILAGDKIVAIDGKPFVGKIVTDDEAKHRLKGPKDSKVRIGILRYGEKNIRQFTVTRGDIPMKSISATYMLNDSVGYMRIKSFGEKTYAEMLASLQKLTILGADKLVIDFATIPADCLSEPCKWPTNSCPRTALLSTRRDERVRVPNTVPTERAATSTFRSSYSSTKARHRHLKYLPEPCKTMTGQPSSGDARSEKAWYNSRLDSPTAAWCG